MHRAAQPAACNIGKRIVAYRRLKRSFLRGAEFVRQSVAGNWPASQPEGRLRPQCVIGEKWSWSVGAFCSAENRPVKSVIIRFLTVLYVVSQIPRGGAVWQLVGLITRRSKVQILPPQPAKTRASARRPLSFLGACPTRAHFVPTPCLHFFRVSRNDLWASCPTG